MAKLGDFLKISLTMCLGTIVIVGIPMIMYTFLHALCDRLYAVLSGGF